jgi:pyrroloquinoline quinone biosynthesis protein B
MRAVVLGAAAGGGFPQWNSNGSACRRARAGDPRARPRTQASVAVSANGAEWFLLNASPDLRQQIEAAPCLHPSEGVRSSPIAGVVLTGGDVDAIAGLLTLRERHAFNLHGTSQMHRVWDANPIFEVLDRDLVARKTIMIGDLATLFMPDGKASGLSLELFSVPGKVPLYLEEAGQSPRIIEDELARRLQAADVVLFDGTLWTDDEMVRGGLGAKTGARMGHMSLSGPDGTLAAFETIDVRRKILIHINNSNPILLDDSPERAMAETAGWEVAYDGMEIEL